MAEQLEKQKKYASRMIFFGVIAGIGFAGSAGISLSDTRITGSNVFLISAGIPFALIVLMIISLFIVMQGLMLSSMTSRGKLSPMFDEEDDSETKS